MDSQCQKDYLRKINYESERVRKISCISPNELITIIIKRRAQLRSTFETND